MVLVVVMVMVVVLFLVLVSVVLPVVLPLLSLSLCFFCGTVVRTVDFALTRECDRFFHRSVLFQDGNRRRFLPFDQYRTAKGVSG